jgi:hypothetical protein
MTERETLLAEIAERQARLAEIDAEPDYEAWRPALEAYYISFWGQPPTLLNFPSDWAKGVIRGLTAALPKAPPMGSVMGEAEIEALAQKCAEYVYAYKDPEKAYAQNAARVAIRETLSRVQPRWPSEAELRKMAELSAPRNPYGVGQCFGMARRIRAYQTGQQP